MDESILYNYLIHYNPFKKLWYGFPRGDYNAYINGETVSKLFISKSSDGVINDIITYEHSRKDNLRS